MTQVKFSQKWSLKAFCTIAALCFLFLQDANANLQEKYKQPLPEIELLPELQFLAQSTRYNETPFDNEFLEFEFRYPSDWTKRDNTGLGKQEESLSSQVLTELARFIGPARLMGERSKIVIEAGLLEYQLNVDQWFYEYVLKSGATVQGLNVNSKDDLEALLIFVDDDITYVIRTRVIINGKRVLLINYYVPINEYQSEGIMQAQVIKSFKVPNKDRSVVEDLNKIKFLDIAEVSYPKSWVTRQASLEDLGLMFAEFLNVGNREVESVADVKDFEGKIDVMLISSVSDKHTLKDELQKKYDQFIDRGAKIGGTVELIDDLALVDEFPFYKSKVYKVVGDEVRISETEYWVTIGYYGYYHYVITLTTPSRNTNFLHWARNTQTYKLVLENLVPLDKGLSIIN